MNSRRVGKLSKNDLEDGATSDACSIQKCSDDDTIAVPRTSISRSLLNVDEISEAFIQNMNITSEEWPLAREYRHNFESGKWPAQMTQDNKDLGYSSCSGTHSDSSDRLSVDSGGDYRQFDSWPPSSKMSSRMRQITICPKLLENIKKEKVEVDFRTLDLFLGDTDQENKLHAAVLNRNVVEFRKIVNSAPKPFFLDAVNHSHHTALHLSVFGGQLMMVRTLLEAGADVLMTDRYGNTALHYAVMNGDTCIVTELLRSCQPDDTVELLNKYNDEGYTVGHLACLSGNSEIVRVLVTYSIKTFDLQAKKTGQTGLHIAVIRNDQELVYILTNNGVNSETPDYCGNTPLLVAAQNRNNASATALVRAGADRSELEQGLYEEMDVDS